MNQRSLVLVTVDCLRADRLSFGGYSQPLTPFLDSLAKNSIVFSDAVVAGAPTYFSLPAIMASRYPLGLGRDVIGIAPGEATLATALQAAGYETAAFIAGNPYLTGRFGYDQGFRQFSDFLTAAPQPEIKNVPTSVRVRWSDLNRNLRRWSRRAKPMERAYEELYFLYCQWRSGRADLSMDELRRYPSAEVLIDAAIGWLKGIPGRPFFLWVHLMDPHHPYYPPSEALDSLGNSDITPKRARFLNSFWNRSDVSPKRLQRYRNEVIALYDAGVHWVDRQLSRLADALKAAQHGEAIFVVTADHGEEFLEHGNRYHSTQGLAEELIRVPLLVHEPKTFGPRVVPGAFSLLHLAPTLLQALEVDVPASFQGRDLWKDVIAGTATSLPAIVETVEGCNNPLSVSDRMGHRLMAVLDGDHKLVLRFGTSENDLYELRNVPQGEEVVPTGLQNVERVRLLQCAQRHLRESRERRDRALALRARLREIRQRIDMRPSAVRTPREHGAVEIGEHG